MRLRHSLPVLAAVAVAAFLATGAPSRMAMAAPDPSDPCYWFVVHWSEMTPHQQELMGELGWSEKSWESADIADDPPNESAYWADLTDEERAINEELGMTEERWDHPPEDCKSA